MAVSLQNYDLGMFSGGYYGKRARHWEAEL